MDTFGFYGRRFGNLFFSRLTEAQLMGLGVAGISGTAYYLITRKYVNVYADHPYLARGLQVALADPIVLRSLNLPSLSGTTVPDSYPLSCRTMNATLVKDRSIGYVKVELTNTNTHEKGFLMLSGTGYEVREDTTEAWYVKVRNLLFATPYRIKEMVFKFFNLGQKSLNVIDESNLIEGANSSKSASDVGSIISNLSHGLQTTFASNNFVNFFKQYFLFNLPLPLDREKFDDYVDVKNRFIESNNTAWNVDTIVYETSNSSNVYTLFGDLEESPFADKVVRKDLFLFADEDKSKKICLGFGVVALLLTTFSGLRRSSHAWNKFKRMRQIFSYSTTHPAIVRAANGVSTKSKDVVLSSENVEFMSAFEFKSQQLFVNHVHVRSRVDNKDYLVKIWTHNRNGGDNEVVSSTLSVIQEPLYAPLNDQIIQSLKLRLVSDLSNDFKPAKMNLISQIKMISS